MMQAPIYRYFFILQYIGKIKVKTSYSTPAGRGGTSGSAIPGRRPAGLRRRRVLPGLRRWTWFSGYRKSAEQESEAPSIWGSESSRFRGVSRNGSFFRRSSRKANSLSSSFHPLTSKLNAACLTGQCSSRWATATSQEMKSES